MSRWRRARPGAESARCTCASLESDLEPERWRRIETLYHAARQRPESERTAFLADACPRDVLLLTGEPPFVRGTAAQLRLAHISEPAVFPEQAAIAVPADLQSVVLRCLEKDPARRFQSADRLSQALADCTTNP